MLYYIKYLNNFTDSAVYKILFFIGGIFFVILSYLIQINGEKRCPSSWGELLRIFHHLIVYFLFCGYLAPTSILWITCIIYCMSLISWIFFNKRCILTILENNMCKLSKNRTFHDLLFDLSIKLSNLCVKIRIPMYTIITIFIFLRLYVYTKGNNNNNNNVEIQGHRGARGNYPENTLSGFRYAIENDIDTLELDLQMTKDKEIIIYHDKQINTTICSHPSALIKDLSLSEIQKYDCGSKQNPNFPQQKIVVGERIPSFKELIEMVQNEYYYKSIKMNVEIKTKQNVDADEEVYEFTNKLIEMIHQYNLQNKITIQSFDTRALEYMKQIDSKIKTSFLIERAQPINDEIIQLAKKLNVQIITPDYHLIDKNIVDKLKQHGFEVWSFTINDVDTLRQQVKYGVNGIITDYPKQMKDYLSQQM